MANNSNDYWQYGLPEGWVAPITEAESKVGTWTPMEKLSVPPAPASASPSFSPESGYSAKPNYTSGYTPLPYNSPAAATNQNQVDEWGAGMDTWRHGSPADLRKANLAARSGGGGSSAGTPTTTTSRTVFTQPRPTAPTLPKLKLPKVNKRAVAALQQKHAAPGVRKLRESMQLALASGSDNPNVRRMTIREAMQGYGTGLESVMAGAYGTARSEHLADVQQEGQEAQLNWQAEVNRQNQLYQQAMNEYMNSATRVTESGPSDSVGVPAASSNAPSLGARAMTIRNAYAALQPYGVR